MRAFFAMESRGELPKGTARRWAHHTKNIKDLPEHKKESSMFADLGRQASLDASLIKLAQASSLDPAAVLSVLARFGLDKEAVVKSASEKRGGMRETILAALKGFMRPQSLGAKARTAGTVAGVGGGVGLLAALHNRGPSAAAPSAAPGVPEAGAAPAVAPGGSGAVSPGPAAAASAPAPGLASVTAPGGSGQDLSPHGIAKLQGLNPAEPEAPGGGMGLGKGLLLGGGLLAGGYGAHKLLQSLRNRKKKPEPEAKTAGESLLIRALEKKADELIARGTLELMVGYADRLASYLPVEKQASLRSLQRGLSFGLPFTEAMKTAYPHLTGEQRGVLAYRMAKGAMDVFGKRKATKTVGRSSFLGSPAKARSALSTP